MGEEDTSGTQATSDEELVCQVGASATSGGKGKDRAAREVNVLSANERNRIREKKKKMAAAELAAFNQQSDD